MKLKDIVYIVGASLPAPLRGDGGDGDEPPAPPADTVTLSKAELDSLKSSIAKLESKRDELITENKSFKDQMKVWDGLDPDSVKGMLQNFENDEEKKLIAEGKFDDVIKKRTERISAEFGGKISTLEKERDQFKIQAEQYQSRISNMAIDTNIVESFVREKGLESAIEDVKYRAKATWRYEDGELIPRDKDGEIIQGESGVLTPKEWIKNLQKTAPHLFPESVGGGASGNNSRGGANTLEERMIAARKAGDVKELRRLAAIQRKKESGED